MCAGKPEKSGYFVLLRKDKSKVLAIPIELWYAFKKDRHNSETTLEEAEQALKDRQKHQDAVTKRDLRKTSLFAEGDRPLPVHKSYKAFHVANKTTRRQQCFKQTDSP